MGMGEELVLRDLTSVHVSEEGDVWMLNLPGGDER